MEISLSSVVVESCLRVIFCNKEEKAALLSGVRDEEFEGKQNQLFLLQDGDTRILYVGIDVLTYSKVREASGSAVRRALSLGYSGIQFESDCYFSESEAIVLGSVLAAYKFETFKTSGKREVCLEKIIFFAEDVSEECLHRANQGFAIADSINRIREFGNLPGNHFYPEKLADEVVEMSALYPWKINILDKESLSKQGFGGILNVSKGSSREGRFVEIKAETPKPNCPNITLVGKAITFDSGGLSLKPSSSMEEMKFDKMGGLAVLAIMEAVTRLDLPVNLTALICAAENMPGQSAVRPGDIITVYGGQTVEILNTDAEGRLVLADGLAYARDNLKSDLIIDLATLTGACCVALGLERTGVFSDDFELSTSFMKLGESIGDPCWPLPIGDEYSEAMKCDYADLKNMASSRWGGASHAASFLKEFVGENSYVHLDIAGPMDLKKPSSFLEAGASGAGVRLVIEYLRSLIK